MNRRNFLLASLAATLPTATFGKSSLAMGQLLITGFRGTKPGDPEVDKVRGYLETGACAGVILLRRNCTSPEQVTRLVSSFREAAGSFTPIVSIDQEGGRVARLDAGNGFFDWMSARDIVTSGMSDAEIRAYWAERAWQLKKVGINLNFAPVVDLDINPANPIIGKLGRSFGKNPARVAQLAELFIVAHRSAGVMTSLKHFPGHGSSTTDSHKETADVSGTWRLTELDPYATLIQGGLVDSVMNGHLLHSSYSDTPYQPTSMSWNSVKAIRDLVFAGPIITDDMQMAAVESIVPAAEAALAAVNAGNTFLIYSNYRKSDLIDTVVRIASSLTVNMDRMSSTDVATQIELARQFRSKLT